MQHPLLFGFLLTLLFSSFTPCAKAENASAKSAAPVLSDAQFAAGAVFELFENKCNDCHGAHLTRPKGKFGYVMDLKRVAANDDYVVAGDAAKSELFRLVNEDEMPGKEAKCGNATRAEKLALRAWIQLGAPTQLPTDLAARQAKLMEAKEAPVAVKKDDSFIGKLMEWLGRFHAASTHFPIALLMAALLSETLGWWTRKESWLACTRLLVISGAGGAVATATLGWFNAYAGVSQVYQFHKWFGTATAAWAVLCVGAAIFYECREGSPERNRLRGALFFGAVLVGLTGFLGGAIVYGLDHYNW